MGQPLFEVPVIMKVPVITTVPINVLVVPPYAHVCRQIHVHRPRPQGKRRQSSRLQSSPLFVSVSCIFVLCSLRTTIQTSLHFVFASYNFVISSHQVVRPRLIYLIATPPRPFLASLTRCLVLRRSARHYVLQTPSYSTYNLLSYYSGARLQIWAADSLSSPIRNRDYISCPKNFKVVEAMRAKEKEPAANIIAKEKEAAPKVVAKLGDMGSIDVPNVHALLVNL